MQHKLNKEKKEFFLAINSVVNLWLTERKHKNLPPLIEVGHFCVVTDTLFNEYDAFHDAYKKTHNNEIILPDCALIHHYSKKQSLRFTELILYGAKFIDFPADRIDEFCEWIREIQTHFYAEGAKALQ